MSVIEASDYSLWEHLRLLKQDSDEIPEFIIHSTNPDNCYKVRSGWWTGLAADLISMIEEDLIDNPELVATISQFITDYRELKIPHEMTTKEDIIIGNLILDMVLACRKS